jgi:hypothetical protein
MPIFMRSRRVRCPPRPVRGRLRFHREHGGRYVRSPLLSGHDNARRRWTLGEFMVNDMNGQNVAADTRRNGRTKPRTGSSSIIKRRWARCWWTRVMSPHASPLTRPGSASKRSRRARPPVHNVSVDSLLASSAVDEIQVEFWPFIPKADGLWVVKDTASAGRVCGKPRLHMESFTSFEGWREGPQDLKPSADSARS